MNELHKYTSPGHTCNFDNINLNCCDEITQQNERTNSHSEKHTSTIATTVNTGLLKHIPTQREVYRAMIKNGGTIVDRFA